MHIQLMVEDIEPDHWVAWAVGLPGCFSSAAQRQEAVDRAPQRIEQYFAWVARHDRAAPGGAASIETEVVETFQSYPSHVDPSYIVNAFFAHDRPPLEYWETVNLVRMLAWTRQELLEAVDSLSPGQLNAPLDDEVQGSIAGILEHVAIAENWYFQRLGCGLKRVDLSGSPLENLARVRTNTLLRLVELIGDGQITQALGESWSARKAARRTLWHERDHTQHIRKLGAK